MTLQNITTARALRQWRDRGLSLLFPPACLACSRIEGHRALPLGLCSACRSRLEPLPFGDGPGAEIACAGCGEPLRAAAAPPGYRCGDCRRRPPPFERLLAGWSYAPPFDAVIHGLKFGRLVYLGEHLAGALAARLAAEAAAPRRTAPDPAPRAVCGAIDLVVPVPLHWRRRLGRGYNQAEEIARPLARRLGLPFARALRRRRATLPQSGLERRRRAGNLRAAFRARRQADLGGRSVLLVDDVVTTGSTLRAAASSLRDGGAERVVALAAGRTPSSGQDLAEKLSPDARIHRWL